MKFFIGQVRHIPTNPIETFKIFSRKNIKTAAAAETLVVQLFTSHLNKLTAPFQS